MSEDQARRPMSEETRAALLKAVAICEKHSNEWRAHYAADRSNVSAAVAATEADMCADDIRRLLDEPVNDGASQ